MGIHDGHRERMKKRFAEGRLSGFDDINALEMLLFYALPRQDTNALAHRLIDRFGSLARVLSADMAELESVDGIGENAAMLICLVTQINKRYLESRSIEKQRITSIADAGEYFIAKFAYETCEISYALLLNNSGGIIACREIGRGVVNAANIRVRRLVELAIEHKAASVIVAHNHPDGETQPSVEDELSTSSMRSALGLVGVKLIDHIIVSGDRFFSFADMHILY